MAPDPAATDPPLGLQPRMYFVTGKGGVGKSTVAAALSLAFRDAGVRTLLVEIAGQDPAARLLAPRTEIGYEPTPIAPRLQALSIDPENALREYARIRLKVKAIADRMVGNQVFSQFADAAPGFRELLVLGKLWQLAQETGPRNKPRYEAIIVDAPATGHGMALLGMAGVVARMFPVGPIASEAREIDAFVRDPNQVQVVLVSLPEELPVTETIELHGRMREQEITVGATVLNAVVRDRFSDSEVATLADLLANGVADEAAQAALEVASFEHARSVQQAEERARLETVTGPAFALPLLFRDRLKRSDIQGLADLLAPAEQEALVESLT